MRRRRQRAAAPSGELTLELTRVLPAARSVVFGAFSDPTEPANWWLYKVSGREIMDAGPREARAFRTGDSAGFYSGRRCSVRGAAGTGSTSGSTRLRYQLSYHPLVESLGRRSQITLAAALQRR